MTNSMGMFTWTVVAPPADIPPTMRTPSDPSLFRARGRIASGPASPITPVRPPLMPNAVGVLTTLLVKAPPVANICTPLAQAPPSACMAAQFEYALPV